MKFPEILSSFIDTGIVFEAGLGYRLSSIRVNERSITDEPGLIKIMSSPTDRLDDVSADQAYEGSFAAVRVMRLIYKSRDGRTKIELPPGLFMSLYVSRGKVANIIFSPHLRPLNLQQTIDLIVLLEDRLRRAKWRSVSEKSKNDFMTFLATGQTGHAWRYASVWKNEESDFIQIRCERMARSRHVAARWFAQQARFLVSVHFNNEGILLDAETSPGHT